jgi:chitin disaccharide deacetylase
MSNFFLNHGLTLLSTLVGRIKFAGLGLAGSVDRRRRGIALPRPHESGSAVMNREADEMPSPQSIGLERRHLGDIPSPVAELGPGRTPDRGVLIINADDWGRNQENTDRTVECVRNGTVSSVSAMVFMEDSERAAAIARESGIDAGLHLNFTAPFSAANCPAPLQERQRELSSYLLRHRFAQTVFHPGLVRSFEYVVLAQLEEYRRLYGSDTPRIDGQHHMHLCANVLLGKLLPAGCIVRRNFSSMPGERGFWNRLYRKIGDYVLAKRHPTTDLFFSLAPLKPVDRLERIFGLARRLVVELETHPVNPEEYRFLAGGEVLRLFPDLQIARRFASVGTEGHCTPTADCSKSKRRLTCSLPYAFAVGATVYQSLIELSEYL